MHIVIKDTFAPDDSGTPAPTIFGREGRGTTFQTYVLCPAPLLIRVDSDDESVLDAIRAEYEEVV